MTAYFDEVHQQIRDAKQTWRDLDPVEQRLVFDVTVCSEMPHFPEDLRQRIHETVLHYGVCSLPVNDRGPEMETEAQHRQMVHDLCWHLHSIFHDLVYRASEAAATNPEDPLVINFTDDPRQPLRVLYARGEERREALVPAERRLPEPA